METAKIIRGLVMLCLMVAATVPCSHQPAMAEDSQLAQLQGVELSESRENGHPGCYYFIYSCVMSLGNSCISECCESFDSRLPRDYRCACWRSAELGNKQALKVLQSYCAAIQKPTQCYHMQVAAVDNNGSSTNNLQQLQEVGKPASNSCLSNPPQYSTCCARDRENIQSCMLNTASIDQCCPTFRTMLGYNCDCYNYAKNLDNQALITLESYCDVTNPCKSVQAM